MVLWSQRRDMSFATKSKAKSSKSWGCVGRSPRLPKSLGVRTSPSPKCHAHTRLTITRAKRFRAFPEVRACANSARPLPSLKGNESRPPKTSGNRATTESPNAAGFPRRMIFCTVTGDLSFNTMAQASTAGVAARHSSACLCRSRC